LYDFQAYIASTATLTSKTTNIVSIYQKGMIQQYLPYWEL